MSFRVRQESSEIRKSLIDDDSDDENSFLPPKLSDFGSALLKSEVSGKITTHTTLDGVFTRNMDQRTMTTQRVSQNDLKNEVQRLASVRRTKRLGKLGSLGPAKRTMSQDREDVSVTGTVIGNNDSGNINGAESKDGTGNGLNTHNVTPHGFSRLNGDELHTVSREYLEQKRPRRLPVQNVTPPRHVSPQFDFTAEKNKILHEREPLSWVDPNRRPARWESRIDGGDDRNPLKFETERSRFERELKSGPDSRFSRDLYKESEHNRYQNESHFPGEKVSRQTMEHRLEQLPTREPPVRESVITTKQPLRDSRGETKPNTQEIVVNNKTYEKLELLGRGGSSKVYKVRCHNKIYALKRVSFDEFDESSINGFKGEIELLLKLRDQQRVVKLIDYQLLTGLLYVVMECGDYDLSHVLAHRTTLDIEFVRYHTIEMLKCVQVVHKAGIVHSDLKPANFVFFKGMLKIIDFGIANSVPDHTVNVYRESQIGTPNYMSPEALVNEGDSTWKVGKPSDIWSCGCILYQLVYGRPPYGGYQGSQRLLAIMNPKVKVVFPEKGLGGVSVPRSCIETMQACLVRDPGRRWTVEQLLGGSFLQPRVVSQQFITDLVKNAIAFGVGKEKVENDEVDGLARDVWRRIGELKL